MSTPDTDHMELFKDSSEQELKRMERLLMMRDTRLEFALEHHVNTRGERMSFSRYPHIKDIYNTIAPEIVIQGSVQSFKSEWAVIDHFASAYTGLSVFFVIPKYELRNTYVQNRVNRCVENVPEYKKIIGSGFFDSVAMKSFGKGVIKYVGSNVLADFKEFPADMIIVEEVDECNEDNVNYALDRIRASDYQFKRYLGNPKMRGHGINAFFQKSDQREWEVPCRGCGTYQELDWFKCVVEDILDKEGNIVDYRLRDKEWRIGIKRDINVICPECGSPLERADPLGRWNPKNPGGGMEGYHFSMLCSPINSIAGMWDRFQKAIHDPSKMQQFYNSDLGLPYTALGNRVTDSLLDMCTVKDYKLVIKPDCAHIEGDSHPGPCSMGVDVGGVFDVRISHVLPRGKRQAVFIGKVPSNLDELLDMIRRYNVEKVVIDSMPEITLVQDFQEIAPCDVWLCRYRSEGKDRRRTYDTMDRIINTDRTEALDRSFAQLRQRRNLLPENYGLILSGEYSQEMCLPIRQLVEMDSGEVKYEWTKGKDHQRHCDTYDMLAANLLMEDTLDEIVVG